MGPARLPTQNYVDDDDHARFLPQHLRDYLEDLLNETLEDLSHIWDQGSISDSRGQRINEFGFLAANMTFGRCET